VLEASKLFDVLVTGDLVLDNIIYLDGLPQPEGVQMAHEYKRLAGGAANFAIMASRLGLRVGLVDCVGCDEAGKFLIAILSQEGIDTSLIKVREGKTKQTLVLSTRRGEKSFVGLITKETSTLTLNDIEEEVIQKTKGIYVSGYSIGIKELSSEAMAVLKAIEIARQLGRYVFFDPGPAVTSIDSTHLHYILRRSTILSLNIHEASIIAHLSNPAQIIGALHAFGPKVVALKMGDEGCMLSIEGKILKAPPMKVKTIDSTGAGDAFNAGLLFGLLKGLPPKLVAILANVIGALSVKKMGAGQNLPKKTEVLSFLEEIGETHLAELLR
jgi:sugar/nucleoside kinase (ribokinase family)